MCVCVCVWHARFIRKSYGNSFGTVSGRIVRRWTNRVNNYCLNTTIYIHKYIRFFWRVNPNVFEKIIIRRFVLITAVKVNPSPLVRHLYKHTHAYIYTHVCKAHCYTFFFYSPKVNRTILVRGYRWWRFFLSVSKSKYAINFWTKFTKTGFARVRRNYILKNGFDSRILFLILLEPISSYYYRLLYEKKNLIENQRFR